MSYADDSNQQKQAYKYNGKEFDDMHGLNWYDYSARYFDPAVPRFTSVDPHAEKFYNWSPYVYVYNNPLKFIDPDGKRGRLPMRRGNHGGNRGRRNNYYHNGIRPNSKVITSTNSYVRKGSLNLEPYPTIIGTFETPNFTRVQMTPNNVKGQRLTLKIDLAGVLIQEVKEKFIHYTESGPIEKSTTNIKFSDNNIQNEFNIKQNDYEKEFNSKLNKLNEASMSQNDGQLNTMDYITNMSSVIKELGISPKQQILNYLNQNKNNYNLETKTKESEITEWRQGY